MRAILRPLIFFFSLSALFTLSPDVYSQSYGGIERTQNLSPGMEMITIQNVRYVVPKGTKFSKRADVITFEGPGEYTARRLSEMERRLEESEEKLKHLESLLRSRDSESGITIR